MRRRVSTKLLSPVHCSNQERSSLDHSRPCALSLAATEAKQLKLPSNRPQLTNILAHAARFHLQYGCYCLSPASFCQLGNPEVIFVRRDWSAVSHITQLPARSMSYSIKTDNHCCYSRHANDLAESNCLVVEVPERETEDLSLLPWPRWRGDHAHLCFGSLTLKPKH